MKKLIAMLLAMAVVASLGVTAAFADVTYTNAQSASHYLDRIKYFQDAIDDATFKQDSLNEVQIAWDHYLTEKGMILKTAKDGDEANLSAEMKAKLKELDIDMAIELADLKAKNAGIQYATEEVWNLFKFDEFKDSTKDDVFAVANAEQEALQEIIDIANEKNEEEDNEFLYAFYSKLAAKDAENAAKAKAEADILDKIAKATKGIDTSTSAGQLLYNGTASKIRAEVKVEAAKKAAEAAKKGIETAQKGALAEAQATVLWTQEYAYNQLASEVSAAVAEYVQGVYDAVNDYWANF